MNNETFTITFTIVAHNRQKLNVSFCKNLDCGQFSKQRLGLGYCNVLFNPGSKNVSKKK